MLGLYDFQAPKRATNLSVNSDLLKKARELDINLSAAFEAALAAQVRQNQHERWQAENREAIARYNRDVEEHGVFSDGQRGF